MGRRRLALTGLCIAWFGVASASAPELRVCADPNNLPFSNERREGFENKLVEMVARDLGMTPRYVWWAQRRGNLRNTLNAGRCDVVPGVASGLEMLATTRPYYRSTYVFVTRRGHDMPTSFDDPRLATWLVGVQMIGDDGANTPPAHALSRRGLTGNVRGYPVYGNYANPNPPAAIVDAVARGDIDVAVAWGPMAGYFARHEAVPLQVGPVSPWLDGPQWPMVFDISMGVRKDDIDLRRRLDDALERHRAEIDRLLRSYGVPLVEEPGAPSS
ncbi:mxaJ protein [Luteibacter sp. W1I16]|jgi:mxaJ protein|uniref:substrate-binding domain-containing protein n=1 Tax=Luteibacter sp. W1I16 TaxID=3373922 RepID=UPI003D1E1CBA